MLPVQFNTSLCRDSIIPIYFYVHGYRQARSTSAKTSVEVSSAAEGKENPDTAGESKPAPPTAGPAVCRGTSPWFPRSILSFVILQKGNVNVTHGFCSKLQRSNKPRGMFSSSREMSVKSPARSLLIP